MNKLFIAQNVMRDKKYTIVVKLYAYDQLVPAGAYINNTYIETIHFFRSSYNEQHKQYVATFTYEYSSKDIGNILKFQVEQTTTNTSTIELTAKNTTLDRYVTYGFNVSLDKRTEVSLGGVTKVNISGSGNYISSDGLSHAYSGVEASFSNNPLVYYKSINSVSINAVYGTDITCSCEGETLSKHISSTTLLPHFVFR
ncbi:MAG: hypothetical protein RRY26_03220 [Cellulosilyticaceae bacterium]